MPEEWVELRDLTGPYRGQLRPYLNHAAENAIASGFAEYPEPSLPAEFPGRDALLGAGIDDLGGVPRTAPELTAIPQIGKGTAKKILAALEQE